MATICARCNKPLTLVETTCYRCGKCKRTHCTKHRNAVACATVKGHLCDGLATYVAQWKQQQQARTPPIEAPRVESV